MQKEVRHFVSWLPYFDIRKFCGGGGGSEYDIVRHQKDRNQEDQLFELFGSGIDMALHGAFTDMKLFRYGLVAQSFVTAHLEDATSLGRHAFEPHRDE